MFNGKTILVTGAAGGIGSCLVQMLLKAEAKVIAIDQDAGGLSTLSNMIQDFSNLTIIPSNLSDETSAVEALKEVEVLYGLVHLAGTFDPDNFIIGDTKNVFDQAINANVRNFYSLFIAANPHCVQVATLELFYAVRLLLIEAPISILRIAAPKAQLSEWPGHLRVAKHQTFW